MKIIQSSRGEKLPFLFTSNSEKSLDSLKDVLFYDFENMGLSLISIKNGDPKKIDSLIKEIKNQSKCEYLIHIDINEKSTKKIVDFYFEEKFKNHPAIQMITDTFKIGSNDVYNISQQFSVDKSLVMPTDEEVFSFKIFFNKDEIQKRPDTESDFQMGLRFVIYSIKGFFDELSKQNKTD